MVKLTKTRRVLALRESVARAYSLFDGDHPYLLYRNKHGLYIQHDFVGGSVTIAIGEGGNNFYTVITRSNLRADIAYMGVEEYYEFEAPIYSTIRKPVSIDYKKVVLRPFDTTNIRSILFFGVDSIHLSKQLHTYHAVMSRPDVEIVTAPIFKAKSGEAVKPILSREFVTALLRMGSGSMYCGFFENRLLIRRNNIEIISDGKVNYRRTSIPIIGVIRSFSAEGFLAAARKLWSTDQKRKIGQASLDFSENHLTITNEHGEVEVIPAYHEMFTELSCCVSADAIVSACRGFIGQVHCSGNNPLRLHSLTDNGLQYALIELSNPLSKMTKSIER